MARWGRWTDPNGSAARCEHVQLTRLVIPRTQGCEQCAAAGLEWTSLRLCLSCGWVACSDESPGGHARAHYEETDHAVVAALAADEAWRWCYVHARAV
jgi:uncharacterized UBP type Zn finger protein